MIACDWMETAITDVRMFYRYLAFSLRRVNGAVGQGRDSRVFLRATAAQFIGMMRIRPAVAPRGTGHSPVGPGLAVRAPMSVTGSVAIPFVFFCVV